MQWLIKPLKAQNCSHTQRGTSMRVRTLLLIGVRRDTSPASSRRCQELFEHFTSEVLECMMTSERGRNNSAAPAPAPFPGLPGLPCLLLLVLLTAPRADCLTVKYSIYEEEPPGTVIGNLAADLQLEAAGTFRLMHKSNWSLVEVGESDGQLRVGGRIDREQLCRQQQAGAEPEAEPCLLPFDVVNLSGDKFVLIRVELRVQDINDHAPEFGRPELRVEISESSAPGTRVPLEPALDADVGANSLQRYRLSPSRPFALELRSGADGLRRAELVLVEALDRESQAELVLQLEAEDGGSPARTGAARLRVQVLDSNDNSPAFERASFAVELREDAPPGSLLLQLQAADPDLGPNGDVVYSFNPQLAAAARRLFHLDARSGRLSLAGPLDRESSPSFELEVRAHDRGAPPSAAAACTVTVRVLDVNDNAPEIGIAPLAPGGGGGGGLAYISEAAAPGSLVALVSASDRDSGANGRVSCALSGHEHFALRPAYGSSHMVVTAAALDRERAAEYNLTLVAEDLGAEPRRTVRALTVRLADENDNAPAFSRRLYRVSVLENNQPGAYLTTVVARDPDLAHNGRVTYRLLGPGSALASVDPATGAIYALRSFDRESLAEAELLLQATDGGSPPLSSSATVRLAVADRNDNAPVITHPLPGNGSACVIALPGDAGAGYLATRVRARDADEGVNARLSFRLLSGAQAGLFSIDGGSGQIRLGRRPLGLGALRLVVAVSDGGWPALSATATLQFVVAAAAEAPGGGAPLRPGKRSWDTSLVVIVVLAGGCAALLTAIVGVAATGRSGGKATKLVETAPVPAECRAAPAGGRRRKEASEQRDGELEVGDLLLNSAPSPTESELEVDGSRNSEDLSNLELDPKVAGTNGESLMSESGLHHGTFCAVAIHQDRKTQDVFSGKDSGKGDSDFNDSDSDISGDAMRKGSAAIDQRQNGLSCLEENQFPCNSDSHYSLTSQQEECSKSSPQLKQGYVVAYSSIPTAFLHSSCATINSVLQDHPLKCTHQYGHISKSGLQTSEKVFSRDSGRSVHSFHQPTMQRHNKTHSSAIGTSGHRYQTSYLNMELSEVATSF
ncbi:protocadherin-8-like [Pristis pectinata]|uniref:protocadherin-8-like n=1 Tax=Pristis pectinata TaxID=685728 RepID=UPI00223D8F33|nr:protocadherin-8-like [Pristis pectinata]